MPGQSSALTNSGPNELLSFILTRNLLLLAIGCWQHLIQETRRVAVTMTAQIATGRIGAGHSEAGRPRAQIRHHRQQSRERASLTPGRRFATAMMPARWRIAPIPASRLISRNGAFRKIVCPAPTVHPYLDAGPRAIGAHCVCKPHSPIGECAGRHDRPGRWRSAGAGRCREPSRFRPSLPAGRPARSISTNLWRSARPRPKRS